MLKIIVKYQGKILHTVELEKDRTVHVGRSPDCLIVLPERAGISRKHLQLSLSPEEENKVMVKNLSSLSPLIINGEEVDEGLADTSFQVQNYEFLVQSPKPLVKEEAEGNPPTGEEGALSPPAGENQGEAPAPEDPPPGDEGGDPGALAPLASKDKTAVMEMSGPGSHQMAVYLKVDTESGSKDIFKLKQTQTGWLVGRDSVCDLVMDDSNISRQHFKIIREGTHYFVMDLKSSNGTFLNDKEMKPKKNYRLESGDILSILDRDILFEIKNLSIEQEMARLKSAPPPPAGGALVPSGSVAAGSAAAGGGALVPQPQGGGGGVVPYAAGPSPPGGVFVPPPLLPSQMPGATLEGEDPNLTEGKKWFQNKKFVIYAAVAGVVGFLVLSGEDKKPSPPKVATGPLAGLTAEQKKMIQDTYTSARELYSQGRYEHCRSELKKIHEHTDSYKESKRLEVECAQAAQNQQSQWDLEQKNKKARRLDALIQKVTDKCQKRFNTFKSKADLMTCLKQALELAPADSRVQVLFEQYESKLARLSEIKRKKTIRRKKVQALLRQYEKAKKIRTAGKTIPAINSYKKFMRNSSNYRELASTRELAARELKDMTTRFEAKTKKLQTECENLLQAKKFKEAYYSCQQASEVLPPGAGKGQILSAMKQAKARLQEQMKPLYEDAAIHESIGNIITARQKWNKILDQDIKSGFYYEKTQAKMRKY